MGGYDARSRSVSLHALDLCALAQHNTPAHCDEDGIFFVHDGRTILFPHVHAVVEEVRICAPEHALHVYRFLRTLKENLDHHLTTPPIVGIGPKDGRPFVDWMGLRTAHALLEERLLLDDSIGALLDGMIERIAWESLWEPKSARIPLSAPLVLYDANDPHAIYVSANERRSFLLSLGGVGDLERPVGAAAYALHNIPAEAKPFASDVRVIYHAIEKRIKDAARDAGSTHYLVGAVQHPIGNGAS